MAKLKPLFAFISKIFTSNKKSVVPSLQNDNPIVVTTKEIREIKVNTPIHLERKAHGKEFYPNTSFRPIIYRSQKN